MKALPLDPVVATADDPSLPPELAWLEVPAGEFFDAIPWDGAVPDPDALDAETFLGLL